MWYSGADQDWADVKLSRDGRRARTRPTRSSGCGTTTSSRRTGTTASSRSPPTAAPPGPSRRSTTRPATLVSTDDGYADPNGRMVDFGDKKYGLTGEQPTAGGTTTSTCRAYAGQTVQVRLRQATDEAFLERGWFADDFSVTGGGATTWSDDVEGGANGWTADRRHLHRHHRRRAGTSTPAPRSRRTTTWPSGATSTASTRA